MWGCWVNSGASGLDGVVFVYLFCQDGPPVDIQISISVDVRTYSFHLLGTLITRRLLWLWPEMDFDTWRISQNRVKSQRRVGTPTNSFLYPWGPGRVVRKTLYRNDIISNTGIQQRFHMKYDYVSHFSSKFAPVVENSLQGETTWPFRLTTATWVGKTVKSTFSRHLYDWEIRSTAPEWPKALQLSLSIFHLLMLFHQKYPFGKILLGPIKSLLCCCIWVRCWSITADGIESITSFNWDWKKRKTALMVPTTVGPVCRAFVNSHWLEIIEQLCDTTKYVVGTPHWEKRLR